MYYHRTYIEKSDDFYAMCALISSLNRLHLCDWSLGRLYNFKYGRWSKESQMDSLFEKQAELFFDDLNELCGIVITENFGERYYLLSKKEQELLQSMTHFLLEGGNYKKPYVITLPETDACQTDILNANGFHYASDADVTYTYRSDEIVLPDITLPEKFVLTSQKEFLDARAAELFRFYAFNPNGVFDKTLDYAFQYARKNSILLPELCILLLNEHGEPVSTCMGLFDQENKTMEIEVVATKKEYENKGFAKIVILECMKRGIHKGVKEFSISAWEEKTKKLYSSFGKAQVLKKIDFVLS